jgi:hypothetical protein
MHNANVPTDVELPTSRQLVRSTIAALCTAAAILVLVVLPAEYTIDPTGAGRALGLTQMGEIKVQLAREAAQDRASTASSSAPATPAPAAVPAQARAAPASSAPVGRNDEISVTLAPGEGAEVKLAMQEGARADFSWTAAGGVVNFDLHGDGGGRSISYEQGRSVPRAEGRLEAAFTGNHGWFWRNRGSAPVTVTLRTNGTYSNIRRVA